MSDNFKIVAQFVKDISSETPNIETYFYVREFLKNYSLNINAKSLRTTQKSIGMYLSRSKHSAGNTSASHGAGKCHL